MESLSSRIAMQPTACKRGLRTVMIPGSTFAHHRYASGAWPMTPNPSLGIT